MTTPFTLLLCLLVLPLVGARPADEDEPSSTGDPPPMRLIVRLHRDLVYGIAARPFQREMPVCRRENGNPVRGMTWTSGSVDVTFLDGSERIAFLVQARGATRYYLDAERGPVEATLRGQAPFLVEERIFLNDFHFEGECPRIQVGNCSAITRLDTPRGLFGVIVRIIADRRIPDAKAGADQKIRQAVCEGVLRGFSEQMVRSIQQLNRVTPLEAAMEIVFPGTRGWVVQVSITDNHILIGVGPSGARFPELPTDKLMTEAPVELWIRGPVDPIKLLLLRERLRQAQADLHQAVRPERPLRPEDFSDIRPERIGEWIAIPIGQEVIDEIRRRREQQGR